MSQRLWGSFVREVSSYESFEKLCIELWTYVDLVRAINTTLEQKKGICIELAEMITEIHKRFSALNGCFNQRKNEDRQELIENLETIKDSFVSLFSKEGTLAYAKSLALLSHMIDILKTPDHIKANEAANSMC